MSEVFVQENVPLAFWTTLRIGGPARYFIEARTEKAVLQALEFARTKKLPLFVLGGGSNVLIADEGFPGLVLRVAISGVTWTPSGSTVIVQAGAGEDWDELVKKCVERDLAGTECLSGIPGSVGGTPVQNVGAYGQEVSEVLVSLGVYDHKSEKRVELSNAECGFSYRTSVFNTTERDRYIVLRVTYALREHGAPTVNYTDLKRYFEGRAGTPTLAEVRDAVRAVRASKAMLLVAGDPDCRSAGSFFKNPIVSEEIFAEIEAAARRHNVLAHGEQVPRYPARDGKVKAAAAWLIERSGFHKGYSRGNVGLSAKHTLAIVNRGGATAAEVLALAREIRAGVQRRFGVNLIPEPVFVGFSQEILREFDGWGTRPS